MADEGSAVWFLRDLANEQEADGFNVIEQSGVFTAEGLRFRNSPAVLTTAVGQMGISEGRQGREANNIVKVYVANLRLIEVGTDVLVTAYEPLLINPLSESASAVGSGLAVPATQSACTPMAAIFKVSRCTIGVSSVVPLKEESIQTSPRWQTPTCLIPSLYSFILSSLCNSSMSSYKCLVQNLVSKVGSFVKHMWLGFFR